MAEQNFDLQAVHEAREAVFKFWIDRGATPQQAQQMTEQWGAQGPNKVLELTPEGRTMPPDERAAAIASLKAGADRRRADEAAAAGAQDQRQIDLLQGALGQPRLGQVLDTGQLTAGDPGQPATTGQIDARRRAVSQLGAFAAPGQQAQVEQPMSAEEGRRIRTAEMAEEAQRVAQETQREARVQSARDAAQARKFQKAALLMMQSGMQEIGPRTIGELMSGKPTTAMAQTTADINAARSFFEQSGKIRRSSMKAEEAKKKAQQRRSREQRLKSQAQNKIDAQNKRAKESRTMRRELDAARNATKLAIADKNAANLSARLALMTDRTRSQHIVGMARVGTLGDVANWTDGGKLLRTESEVQRAKLTNARYESKELRSDLERIEQQLSNAKSYAEDFGGNEDTIADLERRRSNKIYELQTSNNKSDLAIEALDAIAKASKGIREERKAKAGNKRSRPKRKRGF